MPDFKYPAKDEYLELEPYDFKSKSYAASIYTNIGGKIDNIYDVIEKIDKENFN